MIDQHFRDFAEKNISLLDELSHMYAEYRIEICEQFWERLSRCLIKDVPEGYFYHSSGRPFKNGSRGERLCGWRRDISEIIGTERQLYICFATWIGSENLIHGEWPIYGAWTGISVWLENQREEQAKLLALFNERSRSLDSEPADNNWRLWRPHHPLNFKAVTAADFHLSLTSDTHPDVIRADMKKWVTEVDDLLAQAHLTYPKDVLRAQG